MSAPFRFKQFTIVQDKSAFKVGTDSVLLGAWAAVEKAPEILDVGTGTGILALMAAQRNHSATITGIDIDLPSVEEAVANFSSTPWSARLLAAQSDLAAWAVKHPGKYGFIISNPPYFSAGLAPADARRYQARHQRSGWEKWMNEISILLRPTGLYATIVPANEKHAVQHTGALCGLHLLRGMQGTFCNGLPVSRVLMEFTKDPMSTTEISSLVIYENNDLYHKDFRDLTQSFYLN